MKNSDEILQQSILEKQRRLQEKKYKICYVHNINKNELKNVAEVDNLQGSKRLPKPGSSQPKIEVEKIYYSIGLSIYTSDQNRFIF